MAFAFAPSFFVYQVFLQTSDVPVYPLPLLLHLRSLSTRAFYRLLMTQFIHCLCFYTSVICPREISTDSQYPTLSIAFASETPFFVYQRFLQTSDVPVYPLPLPLHLRSWSTRDFHRLPMSSFVHLLCS